MCDTEDIFLSWSRDCFLFLDDSDVFSCQTTSLHVFPDSIKTSADLGFVASPIVICNETHKIPMEQTTILPPRFYYAYQGWRVSRS